MKTTHKEFMVGSSPVVETGDDVRVHLETDMDVEVRYNHTSEGLVVDLVAGDGYILDSRSVTTLEHLEVLFGEDIAAEIEQDFEEGI
jgi:hypothetical protein